jgi:hypothetical protein
MNTALIEDNTSTTNITPLNDDIRRIIEVANELIIDGSTAGSTSEQIAAAFVLNDMQYLPGCYSNITEAWARLGHWQEYVKTINDDYRHLVNVHNWEPCKNS